MHAHAPQRQDQLMTQYVVAAVDSCNSAVLLLLVPFGLDAKPLHAQQLPACRLEAELAMFAVLAHLELSSGYPCCPACWVRRKSFIETRSLAAVVVTFSRVYILHAMLLCWMTLLVRKQACSISLLLRWGSILLVVVGRIRQGSFRHVFIAPKSKMTALLGTLIDSVSAVVCIPSITLQTLQWPSYRCLGCWLAFET